MAIFKKKVPEAEVKSCNSVDIISAILNGATNGAGAHSSAYQSNPYVFKAVNIRAESVASIHLILEDNEGTPIEDPNHPIMALLNAPNPRQSSYELMYSIEKELATQGICYILPEKQNNKVKTLTVLPAERVTPQQSTSFLTPVAYYDINLGNETRRVLPSDIIVICPAFKEDGFTPISPLEACSEAVLTMKSAQAYNRAILTNGGTTTMTINVPDKLTASTYNEFANRVRASYTGDKVGSLMILDGGKTATFNNSSNADLQYTQGNDQMAKQIAIALGVNPEVIGDNTSSCFNTMSESAKNFAFQTVVPEITLITRALTRYLCKAYPEVHIGYDSDDINGLRDKPTMADLTACTWLTTNEKRSYFDFEPVDDGDKILVTAGLIPIEDLSIDMDESDTTDPFGDN